MKKLLFILLGIAALILLLMPVLTACGAPAPGSGCLATLRLPVAAMTGANDYFINKSSSTGIPLETPVGNGNIVNVPLRSGDANGDRYINSIDITSVERIIVGLDPAPPEADANGDGNINAADITRIERVIAGLDAFQRGIVFTDWRSFDSLYYGLYTPPGVDQSLNNVAATGANWIMLIVNGGQETISSTTVFRHAHATATDAELRHVIDLAHSLGIKVMFRPQVRLSNDPSHWWGDIGTAFTAESQWQEWFASYRQFVNYYAAFAQGSGVDIFVIGDELRGTATRDQDWRRVVLEVRQQFNRPITYSSVPSNGETEVITWWDAVDYIGVDFYYPLTEKNNPTMEELKAAWVEKGYIALLENYSSRSNKPIIFTEIGYSSQDGNNTHPATILNTALDLQEQADCYQAALEVLWGKPWIKGIFWWQWRAQPSLGGPSDKNCYPNGKPAEEILKLFYLSL